MFCVVLRRQYASTPSASLLTWQRADYFFLLHCYCLQVFDKAGQGFILTAELKHVLSNIGEKLSPQEIADLISEADPDNSGKVLYDNFVKMMLAR